MAQGAEGGPASAASPRASRGKIIVFATRTAGSCARRRTRPGRRSSDCTSRLGSAPRTGGRRHQGRSVRTRAAPDPAGGGAGAVPHPAPRHPGHGPARGPPPGRDRLRPGGGHGGFLVGAYDHIRLANSSPDGIEEAAADGKTIRRGLGDLLGRDAVRQLHEATFFGNDVDPQMVRLATMNLTLRGLDRVRIEHLHIQAAKTAAAATASLMTRSAPADSDRIKADVVYRFMMIRAGSRS